MDAVAPFGPGNLKLACPDTTKISFVQPLCFPNIGICKRAARIGHPTLTVMMAVGMVAANPICGPIASVVAVTRVPPIRVMRMEVGGAVLGTSRVSAGAIVSSAAAKVPVGGSGSILNWTSSALYHR